MPRSRVVLLLWTLGVILLLGAWGHSLFRKTMVRYQQPRRSVEMSLAIVGGSVEFSRATIRGNSKMSVDWFVFPLKEGLVPGPVPKYKLGRFYHNHFEVGHPPHTLARTTVEFPIWTLVLAWSLPCFLFLRRFRKRERTPPPGATTAETSEPDRRG